MYCMLFYPWDTKACVAAWGVFAGFGCHEPWTDPRFPQDINPRYTLQNLHAGLPSHTVFSLRRVIRTHHLESAYLEKKPASNLHITITVGYVVLLKCRA